MGLAPQRLVLALALEELHPNLSSPPRCLEEVGQLPPRRGLDPRVVAEEASRLLLLPTLLPGVVVVVVASAAERRLVVCLVAPTAKLGVGTPINLSLVVEAVVVLVAAPMLEGPPR